MQSFIKDILNTAIQIPGWGEGDDEDSDLLTIMSDKENDVKEANGAGKRRSTDVEALGKSLATHRGDSQVSGNDSNILHPHFGGWKGN